MSTSTRVLINKARVCEQNIDGTTMCGWVFFIFRRGVDFF